MICVRCGGAVIFDDSLVCEPCLEIEFTPRLDSEQRTKAPAKPSTNVAIPMRKLPEE